jgi:hypothetical protein
VQRIGQSMREPVAIDELGRVEMTLLRAGSAPGASVWLDVHAGDAEGGVDEGAGVLATSDPVPFDAITGALGEPVGFEFSGSDRIAIPAEARRVFVVRTDAEVSEKVYLAVRVGAGQYANGNLVFGGVAEAFSDVLYPENGQLPLLYEGDHRTLDSEPHGGVCVIPEFPKFETPDTWYELHPPGFEVLLQEWIDAPDYVEGNPLGVILQPRFDTETRDGPIRRWRDVELVVTWSAPCECAADGPRRPERPGASGASPRTSSPDATSPSSRARAGRSSAACPKDCEAGPRRGPRRWDTCSGPGARGSR